ncbi:YkgJ family cysteine cluster protein [Methanoculleus sp. FWC-SCC3]|uniref:YkgJ family cysteine cluster protein n=1 Tax=Methanoculleus methanifontis TaxID=2584086 RepID=A0ABT8M3W4_9EURY|nr:YkgJ family cysteine cluster protein [Methanoculleus sp. FWC-SCC3]MDN7012828.1 YkgJ family cysteine cluster protein [Methanoculleus sp. FWC-SCC3]
MACKCCQCGSCCSNMGNVHTVIEDRGNYTFVVRNAYSGDVKEVRVDPDKIALFEDASSIEDLPDACPFLRFEPSRVSSAPFHGNVAFEGKKEKAWCTVHLTRPEICRDYCCWRLLILDLEGRRAGRVMYQTTFLPDTDELRRLWERVQPTLNGLSGTEWDDAVISCLTTAGYRVRR